MGLCQLDKGLLQVDNQLQVGILKILKTFITHFLLLAGGLQWVESRTWPLKTCWARPLVLVSRSTILATPSNSSLDLIISSIQNCILWITKGTWMSCSKSWFALLALPGLMFTAKRGISGCSEFASPSLSSIALILSVRVRELLHKGGPPSLIWTMGSNQEPAPIWPLELWRLGSAPGNPELEL